MIRLLRLTIPTAMAYGTTHYIAPNSYLFYTRKLGQRHVEIVVIAGLTTAALTFIVVDSYTPRRTILQSEEQKSQIRTITMICTGAGNAGLAQTSRDWLRQL